MKTKSMIVLLMIGLTTFSYGQSRDGDGGGKFSDWVGKYYLNHTKGVKTLSFRMGGTKYSNWGYIAPEFNMFVHDKVYLNFSPVFDKGAVGRTDYWNLTLNATGAYTVFDLKDRFFFNVHTGIRAGLEKTHNLPYDITESKMVYGGVGGVELEAFFGRLGFSAQLQEIYSRGSQLGAWHYSGTLGLKFIL